MIPILTYHSVNVSGNDYADNDHVALARDLEALHQAGRRILPLETLIDWCRGSAGDEAIGDGVVLTFDDGTCLDWQDVEHPTWGHQRGFAAILRDFSSAHGVTVSATSFVIASPSARAEMDRACLDNLGWWGHDWWPRAVTEGMIEIGSHSWDHLHPTLEQVAHSRNSRGDFTAVDSRTDADAQVARASDEIERLSGRRPRVFAYPWGHVGDYLADRYLPRHGPDLGLVAAVTSEPRGVRRGDNLWRLPRFTCGADWKSPRELIDIASGL